MKKYNHDLLFGASGGIGSQIIELLISERLADEVCLFSHERTLGLTECDGFVRNINLDLTKEESVNEYTPYFSGKNRLFIAHGIRLLETLDSVDLLKMMAVNYVATVKIIRNFLNLASTGSVIIVVSSIASKMPSYAEMGYACSKSALSTALEAMQTEATSRGIALIDLKLGATMTSMTSERMDFEKLIEADELARVINVISTLEFSTLRIPNLEISRQRY